MEAVKVLVLVAVEGVGLVEYQPGLLQQPRIRAAVATGVRPAQEVSAAGVVGVLEQLVLAATLSERCLELEPP